MESPPRIKAVCLQHRWNKCLFCWVLWHAILCKGYPTLAKARWRFHLFHVFWGGKAEFDHHSWACKQRLKADLLALQVRFFNSWIVFSGFIWSETLARGMMFVPWTFQIFPLGGIQHIPNTFSCWIALDFFGWMQLCNGQEYHFPDPFWSGSLVRRLGTWRSDFKGGSSMLLPVADVRDFLKAYQHKSTVLIGQEMSHGMMSDQNICICLAWSMNSMCRASSFQEWQVTLPRSICTDHNAPIQLPCFGFKKYRRLSLGERVGICGDSKSQTSKRPKSVGQGLGDSCSNFELLGDCFSLTALIFCWWVWC